MNPMNIGLSVSGPDTGIAFGQQLVRPMITTGAATLGDVMIVDTTAIAASTSGYAWTTMKDVAAITYHDVIGVALETKAAGAVCRFGFIGDFPCKSTAGNTAGDKLATDDTPTNSLDILSNVAAGCKVVGISLETATTGQVKMVRLNGISGFGNDV